MRDSEPESPSGSRRSRNDSNSPSSLDRNAGDALIESIASAVVQKLLPFLPRATNVTALAYSPREAAQRVPISLSILKTIMAAREIAVVRRGGKVLITEKAILDWFDRTKLDNLRRRDVMDRPGKAERCARQPES